MMPSLCPQYDFQAYFYHFSSIVDLTASALVRRIKSSDFLHVAIFLRPIISLFLAI